MKEEINLSRRPKPVPGFLLHNPSWGGVCHGSSEETAYGQLCALVREEVEELIQAGKSLPPSSTRPMRHAIPA